MAPGDPMTNTPLEFLIEGSDVALDMLYLVARRAGAGRLPEHDVLFVAVSQSDATRGLLDRISAAAPGPGRGRRSTSPERIGNTSRTRAFALLEGAPGIAMPATARTHRAALQAIAAAGCRWPKRCPARSCR